MEGIYDNIEFLPEGWQRIPLGDVITVIRGASPRPKGDPRYFGGDIPWIMISDITREKGKYLSQTKDHVTKAGAGKSRHLKAGTLILSNSGTVCVPKILSVDGCIHDGFVAFPDLPKNFDILYLYYFFEFIRPRIIDAHRQGITQVNLNTGIVKEIKLPIAPLEQQKRIVAEIEKQFSRLDEAVANLKRVKANLKRYKAAVLKAAVEGRLTEKWREEQAAKLEAQGSANAAGVRKSGAALETAEELLKRILAERRQKWEEAELAKMKAKGKLPKDDKWKKRYKEAEPPKQEETYEIPETWEWTNLGQLSWSVKDGPHYSPKYSEKGIPFISGGNIRPEGIDFSSTKYISPELHTELSERCKPEYEDLLYTKGGTTGIARINTETRDFNVWVHVAVLKLVDFIERFYVQHALNSNHCYRQSQRYTHGVGNQDLGLTRMIWITVPLPPLEEQKVIIDEIEQRSTVVVNIEKQVDADLKRAERLRQSILSKAFSGALKIGPNDTL